MSGAGGCAPADILCRAGEGLGNVAGNVANDVFAQMAEAVTEAVGQSVAALGTLWVGIRTPLLTTSPGGAQPSDSVGFLQSNLYVVTIALAVLAVLVGAGRMAWERRGEPLLQLLQALITLVVVSGAGLAVIGVLVTAADALAVALIERSVTGSFGDNLTTMLVGATAVSPVLSPLVVIVLGGTAFLMSLVQIVLMVARGGMLVILAGIFPTAAAFTNTQMGRQWFTKCVAWLIAFILYKPAAAVIYATAFRLTGSNVWDDDGSGIIDVLTGLTLMLLALVALPALMRFVTPMVGAMAAGAAGGAAGSLAAAALPTGAIAAGRALASKSSSSGGGGGGKAPSGPDAGGGGSASDGPSGSSPAGGGSAPSRNGSSSTPAGADASASGATKVPAGVGASSAGASGAGAAGASGASAGAGAAGAGAAGASGAAAAAGPVGAGLVVAGKAFEVANTGRKVATQAGQEAADSATADGGPSGSK